MINKIKVQIIFCIVLLLLMIGCSPVAIPEDNDSKDSYTLTDMAGREIEFLEPAQKVIALQASDVEILYAIGANESLIGVGQYCNFPIEAQNDKIVLASGSETNIESIIALAPDLIIMGVMDQNPEQVAQLEKAGMKVILTNAHDIEGTYAAIELVGKTVGQEEEATKIIVEMQEVFTNLKDKASSNEVKSIYFEVSPLEFGLWVGGNHTFMQEIADILGLNNIFMDVEGWAQISQEQVINRNPDIIVTTTMFFGEGPKPSEEILGRPGWQDISAIKNKAVYNGDGDILTRPGPRLAEGARQLSEFVEQL